MLTTNQSTRTEQSLQGVLVSKNESKTGNDLPEKSSFSKLLSSMQLETASEASVPVSPVEISALTGKGSEGVNLSVMQQLPALDIASNQIDRNLPAALSLHESEDVTLSVMQQLPVSTAASNQADSKLSSELSLHDSEGVPLSVMQQLPVSGAASNQVDSNLSAELNLPDSESVPLSVMQQLPVSGAASDQADSNLSAELNLSDSESAPLSVMQKLPVSGAASNQADSKLSAQLGLNDSDAPLIAVDEIATPLMTPVIDGSEVKADSGVLIPSVVASSNAAKNAEVVEGVNDVILQNAALNQSSVGKENSASVQLNSGVSNAASNSVTNWGTQTHTAMAGVSGGDTQIGAQQGQTFTQGGQSGQNSQGQPGQQQAMMFAQFVKEGKAQALEQQTAVKALDESTLKSDTKDVLGGVGIASTESRGPLPLGLQSIPQPLKHPQWGQALGQRVVFMANNSMQQAQITLNPEKLGQIQVTLQLDKDQKMSVSLNAQNGLTRESMENALPKLREMLEQAGITLGSMDVSDQKQFSDKDSEKPTSRGVASNNAVEEEGTLIESTLSTVKTTDNIVDYYA